jgi:hypothetical protein
MHSGDTTIGPLTYNFDKVNEGVADVLSIDNCLLASNKSEVDNFFNQFLKLNTLVKKPVFTVSINPSDEDLEHLTDDELLMIARDYMQQMGYGEQPAVIFKHRDIERTHLHIVSIRVDMDGNKIDDKFDKTKSSKIRRELEIKYNLTQAQKVKRKKKAENEEKYIAGSRQLIADKLNAGEGLPLDNVRRILRYAHQYNISDFKSYNRVLAIMGLRSEVIDKDGFRGLMYYVIDENGNQISQAVKGSQISKEFSLPKVEKFLSSNATNTYKAEVKKNNRKSVKSIIDRTLKIKTLDYPTFKNILKANGIYVSESRGEGGRIFGITFIDTVGGQIYKGSELGKQYSASNILSQLPPEGMGRIASFQERKQMYKVLSSLYSTAKKEERNELSLLEKIESHRALYIDTLIKENPDILAKDILSVVSAFIDKKNEGKEQIFNKQKAYIENKISFANKISSTITDESTRINLLYSLGFTIEEEEGRFKVKVKDDNHFTFSPSRFNLDIEDYKEPTKISYLSKQDMALLEELIFGRVEDVNFSKFNPYASIFEYLPKEKADMAKRKMLIDAVEKTAKGKTINNKIDNLLNRGFIVRAHRTANGDITYKVGYYKQPVSEYVNVSAAIAQQLNEINYKDTVYNSVKEITNNKIYEYIVDLTLAFDETDKARESKLKYIVEKIRKTDPAMADRVEELIKKEKSKEEIIKQLTTDNNYTEKRKRNTKKL